MALALALAVTPANPMPGATLTATYSVTGEPVAGDVVSTGTATIDGVALTATQTVHFANVEKFDPPTMPGYIFKATADPHVFSGTPMP